MSTTRVSEMPSSRRYAGECDLKMGLVARGSALSVVGSGWGESISSMHVHPAGESQKLRLEEKYAPEPRAQNPV